MSSLRKRAIWVLQIALMVVFVGAGLSKLAGRPEMVAVFGRIGFGQGFRLVTGTLEIVGGLAMLWPRAAWLGAALLACVMIGAFAAHLLVLGGSLAPPVILLALALCVLWVRRPRPQNPGVAS